MTRRRFALLLAAVYLPVATLYTVRWNGSCSAPEAVAVIDLDAQGLSGGGAFTGQCGSDAVVIGNVQWYGVLDTTARCVTKIAPGAPPEGWRPFGFGWWSKRVEAVFVGLKFPYPRIVLPQIFGGGNLRFEKAWSYSGRFSLVERQGNSVRTLLTRRTFNSDGVDEWGDAVCIDLCGRYASYLDYATGADKLWLFRLTPALGTPTRSR